LFFDFRVKEVNMAEPKKVDFEKGLQELNTIVEKLEKGEFNLEESLKHFEKGVKIARQCQTVLENADQKIKILMQKNQTQQLEDYKNQDEES
jgi:exodeoxyribonuclease VII small subunit